MSNKVVAHGRASIADRVYDSLKSDIFAFRLIPGDKFSEGEIATRLQASRTPVREALYRLQREGFVQVLFRSGWQVTPFDFKKIEELYELRITLELAAVEKIAQQTLPPPIIEQLVQTWQPPAAMPLADNDVQCQAVRRLDEAFHCQLVAAAENREVIRIHREVTERLRIVRQLDFTRQDRIGATYEEHSAVLAALLKGKTALACRQLAAHIQQSQEAVRAITMEKIRAAAKLRRETPTDIL